MSLSHEARQYVGATFFSIAFVVPILWMAMDRDPPLAREDGIIAPADPEKCWPRGEVPSDTPVGTISPGSCVEVGWNIINTFRACQPASQYSTFRTIVDSQGVPWPLAPVATTYGKSDQAKVSLRRSFILPSGVAPGLSRYHVVSCFACNPLHVLAPVCSDKPDIYFEVVRP